MDSATAASVYGLKFPVTARSRDDRRILRPGMVDGKTQAQQQLKMAELQEEGRRMSLQPKEEKEDEKPLCGFHAAIAHYDALVAAKKTAVAKEGDWGWERSCLDPSRVSRWPSTIMYN